MTDETTERPALRRREAAAPEAAPAPKKSKYVVTGADIWTDEGRHAVDDVVELTAADAKHFVKVGCLAPYIPGEELEG